MPALARSLDHLSLVGNGRLALAQTATKVLEQLAARDGSGLNDYVTSGERADASVRCTGLGEQSSSRGTGRYHSLTVQV